MKYDFDPITSAAAIAEQHQLRTIRLLVQALEQLDRRLRDLEDDYDNAKPKSEDVISDALEFERNVLSVIECNSHTVYTHIEAEIVRDLEDDYDNAKPKGDDEAQPFDEMVLEVLTVRSGSAREALGFDDAVLRAIEENSYTTFTHIEAEIEGKLEDMTQSYDFAEAVEEAVKGSIVSTVEGVVEDIVHDAIVDAVGDAEDIVRKGLRAIL